ncbi:MAG: HU family DNA-binding protein [Desulfovibrionaceae bacterium]|nr:HU family DNA-binding protein [Desulfovibrionaceae bacterium]
MNNTVTKAGIARSICERSQTLRQQKAKKLLDMTLALMRESLKNDQELLLSGFGKFETFMKRDRRGRNPQTGEDIVLGTHAVLAFRISRKFKAELNQDRE